MPVESVAQGIMMPNVKIGNLVLDKPIIQGGMGIGVSRGRLAGAVAKEGGMGVISPPRSDMTPLYFDQNRRWQTYRSFRLK